MIEAYNILLNIQHLIGQGYLTAIWELRTALLHHLEAPCGISKISGEPVGQIGWQMGGIGGTGGTGASGSRGHHLGGREICRWWKIHLQEEREWRLCIARIRGWTRH